MRHTVCGRSKQRKNTREPEGTAAEERQVSLLIVKIFGPEENAAPKARGAAKRMQRDLGGTNVRPKWFVVLNFSREESERELREKKK